MTPTLSVLTPSFNYEQFLRDCLDSVRAQDGAFEHIVVDDGSSDGSMSVLRERESEIVLRHHPNRGLSATLNRALGLARGEWIGWLNADDFYLPDIVESITIDKDVDVIHGDFVFVEEESRVSRLAPEHRFSKIVLRGYGPFTAPPAIFVRREFLDGFVFEETAIKLMDWDFYLALAERGARFKYVPRVLGAFRRHEQQQSNRPTPASETRLIRSRYGLTTDPRIARFTYLSGAVVHAFLKGTGGGYRRQLVARRSKGLDLRWWRSSADEARTRAFLKEVSR